MREGHRSSRISPSTNILGRKEGSFVCLLSIAVRRSNIPCCQLYWKHTIIRGKVCESASKSCFTRTSSFNGINNLLVSDKCNEPKVCGVTRTLTIHQTTRPDRQREHHGQLTNDLENITNCENNTNETSNQLKFIYILNTISIRSEQTFISLMKIKYITRN